MACRVARILAIAVCLVGASCSDDSPKAANDSVGDAPAIEGLWSGSWGGGEREGVVFQPVVAELLIDGDHVELHEFREAGDVTGTVRFDAGAKRMHITPTSEGAAQPAPKTIEYAYELQGDTLTLIAGDKIPIQLQRQSAANNPLANARVELVTAKGINEAGDLLVTEFTELRAGRAGATYFRPWDRLLKTRQATVLLVQASGTKKITVDEARGLIRASTPVAVAYRQDDRPPPNQLHDLWQDVGPPAPDGEAVGQTLARTLRPGTLVFILSARENVPQP